VTYTCIYFIYAHITAPMTPMAIDTTVHHHFSTSIFYLAVYYFNPIFQIYFTTTD